MHFYIKLLKFFFKKWKKYLVQLNKKKYFFWMNFIVPLVNNVYLTVFLFYMWRHNLRNPHAPSVTFFFIICRPCCINSPDFINGLIKSETLLLQHAHFILVLHRQQLLLDPLFWLFWWEPGFWNATKIKI